MASLALRNACDWHMRRKRIMMRTVYFSKVMNEIFGKIDVMRVFIADDIMSINCVVRSGEMKVLFILGCLIYIAITRHGVKVVMDIAHHQLFRKVENLRRGVYAVFRRGLNRSKCYCSARASRRK